MVPHCDRVQIIPGAQSLVFKRVGYDIGDVSDHVLWTSVSDGKTNQGQFSRGEGAKEKIT